MENRHIMLKTFEESDFSLLASMIPDARFLLQWAGPKYTYPLDVLQLKGELANTVDKKPSSKIFKAIQSDSLETVGHIQLREINYDAFNCVMSRVLIFSDYRGKGFGKAMVRLAVKYAFENLGLNEVLLNVYDFNKKAIATYRDIGFNDYQKTKDACKFQNESWNSIRMKLKKDVWNQVVT